MGSLFSGNLQYLWHGARYRTKVTIDDQYEATYALSIGAKINDLGWPWRAITIYALCFKTRASFLAHHENLNEDKSESWLRLYPRTPYNLALPWSPHTVAPKLCRGPSWPCALPQALWCYKNCCKSLNSSPSFHCISRESVRSCCHCCWNCKTCACTRLVFRHCWLCTLTSVLQGEAKNDPSTKTSISLKRRNIFVRNFQRLLGRKFAIDRTSFVQYYTSLRKWCDFWFSMRYFQVNAPYYRFKLKLQNNRVPS